MEREEKKKRGGERTNSEREREKVKRRARAI